jgi:hypothetical protein
MHYKFIQEIHTYYVRQKSQALGGLLIDVLSQWSTFCSDNHLFRAYRGFETDSVDRVE